MKKESKNNLKSGAMSTLSVLGGLSAGVLGVNKLPAQFGKWVLLGTGVFGPFLVKNKDMQVFLASIGAVGGAKVIKDFTAGKTGVLSMVNSFTPTLAGVGRLGTPTVYGRLGALGNSLNPPTPMNLTRSLTGAGMGNMSMDEEFANALT